MLQSIATRQNILNSLNVNDSIGNYLLVFRFRDKQAFDVAKTILCFKEYYMSNNRTPFSFQSGTL